MRKILLCIVALIWAGLILVGCGNAESSGKATVPDVENEKLTKIYVRYSQVTKAVNLDYAITNTYQFNESGEPISFIVDYGDEHEGGSTTYHYIKGDLGDRLNQFWNEAQADQLAGKEFDQRKYDKLQAEIAEMGYEEENTNLVFVDDEGKPVHQISTNSGDSLLAEYDKDGHIIRRWVCDVSITNKESTATYSEDGKLIATHGIVNFYNSDNADAYYDTAYHYDLEGKLIQTDQTNFYAMDQTEYTLYKKLIYDETGKQIRQEEYDENWNYAGKREVIYDVYGNITKYQDYNENSALVLWSECMYTEIQIPESMVNYITGIYDWLNIPYNVAK